jgi:hypothetical protein
MKINFSHDNRSQPKLVTSRTFQAASEGCFDTLVSVVCAKLVSYAISISSQT